jgi:hypothetical protein
MFSPNVEQVSGARKTERLRPFLFLAGFIGKLNVSGGARPRQAQHAIKYDDLGITDLVSQNSDKAVLRKSRNGWALDRMPRQHYISMQTR